MYKDEARLICIRQISCGNGIKETRYGKSIFCDLGNGRQSK